MKKKRAFLFSVHILVQTKLPCEYDHRKLNLQKMFLQHLHSSHHQFKSARQWEVMKATKRSEENMVCNTGPLFCNITIFFVMIEDELSHGGPTQNKQFTNHCIKPWNPSFTAASTGLRSEVKQHLGTGRDAPCLVKGHVSLIFHYTTLLHSAF